MAADIAEKLTNPILKLNSRILHNFASKGKCEKY